MESFPLTGLVFTPQKHYIGALGKYLFDTDLLSFFMKRSFRRAMPHFQVHTMVKTRKILLLSVLSKNKIFHKINKRSMT